MGSVEKLRSQAQETPAQLSEVIEFDDFWALYPRHVAKKAARTAWSKIPARLHLAILEACVSWRPIWNTKDVEYLPHPASWLNGERWEDELPRGVTVSHGSHVDARVPVLPAHTIMPEHVRAALAKYRKT